MNATKWVWVAAVLIAVGHAQGKKDAQEEVAVSTFEANLVSKLRAFGSGTQLVALGTEIQAGRSGLAGLEPFWLLT
jgi:hypothetical protein